MFTKGSKVYGITRMKCPRCHEGDLFESKNAYDFKNMAKMHEECPVCKQSFSPEPNFYYGAMYVSYAYSVALFVAVYVISAVFLDLGIWATISLLAGVLLVLSPYLFRLSRSTYIHIFVKYDKNALG
ncbi:MAG: DUF983 domain-containing protein [Schleiferiaceae bacterium]|jgi:uncharacterized protein (DUF983 family)|nr:DUF983 domain-containing protein [Schleiferiaceae bacterium]